MMPKYEACHSLTKKQHFRYLHLVMQAAMPSKRMKPVRLMLIIATIAYPFIIFSSDNAAAFLDPMMLFMLFLRSALTLAVIALTYPLPCAALISFFSRKDYVIKPVQYSLYEDELHVTLKDVQPAKQPKPVVYKDIAGIIADDEAYYLLVPQKGQATPAAIVLNKAQLPSEPGSAFQRFLEEKTGKTIQPISDSGRLPDAPAQTSVSAEPVRISSASEKDESSDAVRFTVTHTLTSEQHRQCVMLTTKRTMRDIRIFQVVGSSLLLIGMLWFASHDASGYILVAMLLISILEGIFKPQFHAASSSRSYKERYENMPVCYSFNDQSICIRFSNAWETPVQVPYTYIAAIIETDSELYLCARQKEAVIVLPKASFTLDALNDLRSFLADKTAKKIETV